MMANKKVRKEHKFKPYESMEHPGLRIQIDVKVVPRQCIPDKGLRLFQYTAIASLAAVLDSFSVQYV